jgi:hypothetical protein
MRVARARWFWRRRRTGCHGGPEMPEKLGRGSDTCLHRLQLFFRKVYVSWILFNLSPNQLDVTDVTQFATYINTQHSRN